MLFTIVYYYQTGMKTNGGRKLLVASVEQTTSPNDGIDGSDDSGPPYRSVLVVSRTLSGGSSTTATYAEVYTSHKNSTNSGKLIANFITCQYITYT